MLLLAAEAVHNPLAAATTNVAEQQACLPVNF
jgi:hypothetical protein